MHFTTVAKTLLTLAASVSAAKDIRIDVGKDGLSFSPNNVQADVGDVLEFHFWPMNHSVVMGDATNPCQPATQGGFFSGFLQTANGENPMVFHAMVNTTEPMFFYCSAEDNCKQGMAGVVNQRDDMTLEMYQQRAASVASASSPQDAYGGVLTNSNIPEGCPAGGTLVPAPTGTGWAEPSNGMVPPTATAIAGASSVAGSMGFALAGAVGAAVLLL